ncbi:MAG: hypothetical protein M0Z36_09755 [Thermaerobacter sp.]|nr:hypothetical protein [Thermaerobacter sp.]
MAAALQKIWVKIRAKAGREYVHNTIAHLHAPQGRYLLNGLGTEAVLRLVVAFLLQHEVPSEYYVLVDGARILHAAILTRLAAWLPLVEDSCRRRHCSDALVNHSQVGCFAHLAKMTARFSVGYKCLLLESSETVRRFSIAS